MVNVGDENISPNWAWNVGVDAVYVFNNRIYAANGGHPAVGHNGSIIRSLTDNPDACQYDMSGGNPDNCDNAWREIGPRTKPAWHNGNQRFSLELNGIANLIPGDKAHAQFADFNGRLYLTRTACNVTGSGSDYDAAYHTTAGCTDGTYTNRVTQLWKCDPTNGGADGMNPTTCEASEWVLVDGISGVTDGRTNFGRANNHSMTLLIKNGTRLYVGFDNTTGVELWRTKTGVTNPATEDDFEQVGSTGFDNPANVKHIFSAISISLGIDNYIYLSVGKSGVPVAVYRNRDN